ncbi:hypothetical protein NM208_g1168 [Fusarium decemcellulare]|uniref:Uncharacterized protein n=1 Tax=Fusarium decemcellulare TaxID=57161 RepID=A0ACC1SX60_9HYPO|nr:hypothetical protein NM208_g1168 [Fusarium decemcellulare]
MLLGLLGRYGDRGDKGVLQKTGVRRDIEGERASIRRFQFPREAIEEKRRAPRRRRSSYYSGSLVSSSGFDRDSDSDNNSDSDSDAQPIGITMRRSKYGVITFGPSPQPTIYGITGTMEALGRHKGSWSYLTSISFVPHTAREIFASGVRERHEHRSLQTLFWMAHGSLPHGGTREGRQTVVSLEGPGPLDVGLDHPECLSDDWPAYSLQESDEIPVSMGLMMRRLGIPEPKVLQFLPVDAATQEKRITEALEEKRRNEDTASEAPALSSLTVTDLWVYYSRPSQDQFCAFRKADMERVLTLILTLEWDDWGFLILKDKLWISLLRKTIDILEVEELPKSAFAKTTGLSAHARCFRWRQGRDFNQQKLADHLALDKFLTAYCEKHGLLPLRRALGTLYILDKSLREMTETACKRLSEADRRGSKEEIIKAKERVEELEKTLAEIQCSHRDATLPYMDDKPDGLPIVVDNKAEVKGGKELNTRLLTVDLEFESLDSLGISWEYDPSDLRYLLVKRVIPEWELQLLWQHTYVLEELATARRAYEEVREGVLEYQCKVMRLRWYSDKTSTAEFKSWQLKLRDVVLKDGKKSMWIEEKDMVMIGLWVANRAAMWIGAQDSRPLLHFVGDLDTYLYVL